MEKFRKILNLSKGYTNTLSLKEEKITIINQYQLFIQNYRELIEITDTTIHLKNLMVNGKNLKIASISKYFIEIIGQIESVRYLEVK